MSELSHSERPQALAGLRILAGPRHGERLAVTSLEATIGKGADSDIVIEDDSVSTQHALLSFEHGGWRLMDLNSTNGTYVEGTRLAPEVPTPLQYGSSIRFGGVRVQLLEVPNLDLEAAAAAAAAEAGTTPPSGRPQPTGFRLPVWALVLLVIVLLLGILVYRWTNTPAAELPVPEAVALLSDPGSDTSWR